MSVDSYEGIWELAIEDPLFHQFMIAVAGYLSDSSAKIKDRRGGTTKAGNILGVLINIRSVNEQIILENNYEEIFRKGGADKWLTSVSYTHLRAHETDSY